MSAPAASTPQADRPRTVVTDKSFMIKERDSFYASWMLSFWRELFQNSVDAGAKTIRIEVAETRQKGSFGRAPAPKNVTRVVFADDGCGMDARTLDDVYFRMGASTKADDDTTVGGFGRARLMTNFSQTRYSIETRDRYVEGDGVEFVNYSRNEAVAALGRWRDAAQGRIEPGRNDGADGRPDAVAEWHAAARDQIEADRLRLAAAETFGGCRVEVDLPPDQRDRSGHRSTVAGMLETLNLYLDQSDLKCEVVVDGVPYRKPATKYERRKSLVATVKAADLDGSWKANPKIQTTERPDGDVDVKFATVRVVPDGKCPESVRHKLVYRVNGASMFTDRTDVASAIYLEIEPAVARAVLTSNRDGLKEPFASAVEDYKRQLATDAQKATRPDAATQFTLLPGGLGGKVARRRRNDEISLDEALAIAALRGELGGGAAANVETQTRTQSYHGADWTWTEFLQGRLEGVDSALLLPWLEEAAKAEGIAGTLLEKYRDRTKAESFLITLKNSGPHRAMAFASGTLLAFITDSLEIQKIARDIVEREKYRDRLADLNDVPILKDNIEPPADRLDAEEVRKRRGKLSAAIRRHDPRNWDPAEGKGLQARRVLAAWQTAVDNVVTEMLEAYPHLKEFAYASGWVFSHPQWNYSSLSGEYGWRAPAAMLKKDGNGDKAVSHFLLDPLDADRDFRMKYNPSDPDDRDRLISLAAHEAGHVVVDHGHNDAFAEVLTTLMERLTIKARRRIHDEIKTAVKAVEKIYSESRTRVVPLDDEPGPRPAERLAAGTGLDCRRDPADIEPCESREPAPGM